MQFGARSLFTAVCETIGQTHFTHDTKFQSPPMCTNLGILSLLLNPSENVQKGNRTKSRYGRFFERFGTVKSWESSGHPLHDKRSVGGQIGVLRTIAASAVTCLRGENSKKEIVKSSTPGPKPYPVTFLLNSTLRVCACDFASSRPPSPHHRLRHTYFPFLPQPHDI